MTNSLPWGTHPQYQKHRWFVTKDMTVNLQSRVLEKQFLKSPSILRLLFFADLNKCVSFEWIWMLTINETG